MPDRSSSGGWSDDLRARLAGLRLDPAREAGIVEELSQHLDDRYEELRAAGSSHAEARRLVLEELQEAGGFAQGMGSLSQSHVTTPGVRQEQPSTALLDGSWQDLRHAVRAARKRPGFTTTIVLTLALGIAANATVFTLVNGALLRPLPFGDAERFVRLGTRNLQNAQSPNGGVSYQDLQDWRTAARRTFADIGAAAEAGVDVSGDERPAARVSAAFVSWNMFGLIGAAPALGRNFVQTDDRAGAPPVVILGGNLWHARYGADPAIVGRTIRVSGVPSTVVGVMPGDFAFPYEAQLWRPLAALPEEARASRSARVLGAYGRLKPAITIEQARADLAGITASLADRYPDTNGHTEARVEPFGGIAAQLVAVMVALLGAVGFVLLIACANVANLLLARAADRSRDVTLRLALGANRWRIVRQFLLESLLLAAAGGLCGLGLSYAGVQALVGSIGPEAAPPYWVRFTFDRTVFAYFFAICTGSAILCGLVPAWQAARTDLTAALNDAGRGSAGSRSRRRWIGAFVVAQVTLALVLLTGAALMMENLIRLVRTDAGIDTGGLMRMAFDLRQSGETPEGQLVFLRQLEDRLVSHPRVDAALASSAPMGGAIVQRLRVAGRPAGDPESLPLVSHLRVGRGYFDVIGATRIAGRLFTAEDLRSAGGSVVVNERFARMYFQHETAIGRRILLESQTASPGSADTAEWMTIVGVVGDVRQRPLPSGDFDPVVYTPYVAAPPQTMMVLARAASGPAAALASVREEVRALNPDLPLFDVSTVDEALASQRWPQRLFGSMFVVFACTAMLLATCGIYAVAAYAVSRRTREIGVRIALGADGRRIWWAVTGTTVRQLAIGLALGTAGAAAVATVLPAMLVGTGGANPFIFAGVAMVLIAAGLAACAGPSRRAMHVDPVTALQAE